MADLDALKEILSLLREAYPSAPEVTPARAQLYLLTLADIPAGLLKSAVVHHIATNRFFPAVAELREAAFSLCEMAEERDDGYTAWGKLQAALHQGYGYYRAPRFANPLIQRALDSMGGWQMFCLSEENDRAWRARFIQAYETYLQREREERRLLPVVREQVQQMAEAHRAFALPKPDEAAVDKPADVVE